MKISAGILISATALLVFAHCNRINTPEVPLGSIRDGDILLRRGDGLMSKIVTAGDVDGQYSHIGVAVLTDSGMMAVHAVPGEYDYEGDFDRVKIEPVARFFASIAAANGKVVRYPLTVSQQECINRNAVEIARKKVGFDHDYDLNDTTKLYCTELIKLLYDKAGIDINEGRMTEINFIPGPGSYIMPSDIYKNKKFITVFQY